VSGRQAAVVYIAHPLRGDWEANLERAREYVDLALRFGYAPLAPYLMGAHLDDEITRDRMIGIRWDIAVLRRCDEMWLCGDRISEGMEAELAEAERLGLVISRVPSIDAGVNYLENRLILET